MVGESRGALYAEGSLYEEALYENDEGGGLFSELRG